MNDSVLLCAGLSRRRLERALRRHGITIEDVAATAGEALAKLAASPAGAVLVALDVHGDPFDLLRSLRGSGRRVIALDPRPTNEGAIEALQAGAAGYLPLEPMDAGWARALAAAVLGDGAPSDALAAASALTRREWQVLSALAEGKTNRAIAAELFLTPQTVRNHVSSILVKLGARNRAAAARTFVDALQGFRPAMAAPAPDCRLTRRELEVLAGVADGQTNRQIAALLRIAPDTVRDHVSSILGKLQAGNRAAAASRYAELAAAGQQLAS